MQQLYAISDPWLAGILAREVWRVVPGVAAPAGSVPLSDALARPGFQYAKLPAASGVAIQALENLGFRYVDAAVQFEMPAREMRPVSAMDGIRLAVDTDREAVTELARRSFIWSRFHQDQQLPAPLADEIKARWAANYFSGARGDHMVVAERDGQVAGFLQLLRSGTALVIDLIAVDATARRSGLAAAMIGCALRLCGPVEQLLVGTQAANEASIRLYQRLGFRLSSVNLVLHRHDPSEAI